MDKEILEILKEMQGDMKSMQGDMKAMQGDMKSMQSEIKSIKSNQEEHTQILRALEHSAEISKSEHDKMGNGIAHIIGNVESIKKDLSQVELVTANNWADIVKLKAVK